METGDMLKSERNRCQKKRSKKAIQWYTYVSVRIWKLEIVMLKKDVVSITEAQWNARIQKNTVILTVNCTETASQVIELGKQPYF